MLTLKRAVFLFLCCSPTLSLAQPELGHATLDGEAYYFFDLINVRSPEEGKTRLDVYFKVPHSQIQFIKAPGDSFQASYEVSIIILDRDDFQADGKAIKNTVAVATYDETTQRSLYSDLTTSFDLEPGKYKVKIRFDDDESSSIGIQQRVVELRGFENQALGISDVLIADSLAVSDAGDITPFPIVNTPRTQESDLYGYFNVYADASIDDFSVDVYVQDSRKDRVFQNTRSFSRLGDETTVTFVIGDSKLPFGIYNLIIKVTAGDHEAELETAFRILWQGVPLASVDLKSAIDQLRYIARGKDVKKLKKVAADSQRAAFVAYWSALDPSPGTEENELMEEYYRRIQYANQHFGATRDGWKSDRGEVYVLLGAPDNVERDPFTVNLTIPYSSRRVKALEIWDYHHLNKRFIFVDEFGVGDFRLYNPQDLSDVTFVMN